MNRSHLKRQTSSRVMKVSRRFKSWQEMKAEDGAKFGEISVKRNRINTKKIGKRGMFIFTTRV